MAGLHDKDEGNIFDGGQLVELEQTLPETSEQSQHLGNTEGESNGPDPSHPLSHSQLLVILCLLSEVYSIFSVLIISDVLSPSLASIAEWYVALLQTYLLDHEEHGHLGHNGRHQDNDEGQDVGQDLDQSLSPDPPFVLDSRPSVNWRRNIPELIPLSHWSILCEGGGL